MSHKSAGLRLGLTWRQNSRTQETRRGKGLQDAAPRECYPSRHTETPLPKLAYLNSKWSACDMSGQLLICLLGGDPEVKKPFAIAMLVPLLSISDGLSASVTPEILPGSRDCV